MHLFVRVIGRRVFDNRDLLAELSAKANRRFDASGGYQTDHDELMDAVLLELQIQDTCSAHAHIRGPNVG